MRKAFTQRSTSVRKTSYKHSDSIEKAKMQRWMEFFSVGKPPEEKNISLLTTVCSENSVTFC